MVSWQYKKQVAVSIPTCEAEYMALTEATKEAIYLYYTIKAIEQYLKVGIPANIPVIYEDNDAALKLANNPEFHKKSKHIDIRYHFIRNMVIDNKIKLLYISTKEQLADPLTKALPYTILSPWLNKINLV